MPKPLKTLSLLLLLPWSFLASSAHDGHFHEPPPIWQAASGWPDRIIVTYSEDPTSSFAVTWRTDQTVGRTIAQIVEASPDTRFELRARTERAKTERINLELMETLEGTRESLHNYGLGGATHHHSVEFKDLKPDTLYAWRVQGARGKWSEWIQTRTAPANGPIKFVYFGDAQNGVYSHWSRIVRMAYAVVPDADFFLHAGDLVQQGDSDYNWAEWFHASGFIPATIPVIPVPGNHENITVFPEGPDGPRVRTRSPLWRAHFTLPIEESLSETFAESVYRVEFNEDLHVFVVDSARQEFAEQAAWLDAALESSSARWIVVSMHHPYFAPSAFDRRERDARRRDAFAPVIAKHRVDLVLTGHIHTYLRASELEGPARAISGSPNDVGTVFLISASGAKNTDIYSATGLASRVGDTEPDFDDKTVDRVAGNTPMFQVFLIDGDRLDFEARMATGEVYDAFSLEKLPDGRTVMGNGEQAYGETRLFENTGQYIDWWDLR